MDNKYKKILFQALVPFGVHQSGIHSIIHGYVDVIGTGAIKNEYIRLLKEKYDIQKVVRDAVLKSERLDGTDKYFAPWDEQDHRNRFAVYDQEPGYEGKAIWIYYSAMTVGNTPFMDRFRSHWVHGETLEIAIRAFFPGACFENVSLRWDPVPSLDPKAEMTVFLQDFQTTREWLAFQKNGIKPDLIKPPTRLQRYRRQFREWQLEPVEEDLMYYLLALTAIIYIVCLLGASLDVLPQTGYYVFYMDTFCLVLCIIWFTIKYESHDRHNLLFVRLDSLWIPWTVLVIGIGIEMVYRKMRR